MTESLDRLEAALADRYTIDREIGAGGMATVYLAHDLRHARPVAIKVLRPELTEAFGARRFLREIDIAAQLQSPHILPLLDSGEAGGLLYYVMPYVAGESLRDRLAREGGLAVSEAMRLLREIVDGLAHAHRHGVIHRDIKPDNVMLSEGHAMLMDFGVAKALSEGWRADPASDAPRTTLTATGLALGTPTYMAPEQGAADPEVHQRADIYAIGVMAYEMLTGAPPFSGPPHAVLAAHVATPPPPLGGGVPPAISSIVMRCLAKDPDDRYEDAQELLNAIDALVTPTGIMAPTTAAPATRRAWVFAALAVVAVASVGFVLISRLQRQRWIHETALPEVRRLVEAGQGDSAWTLARRVAAIAPDDSMLSTTWPTFATWRGFTVRPEGVQVSRASLSDTSSWVQLGTAPQDSFWLPRQLGLYRFEKPGYRVLTIVSNGGSYPIVLDPVEGPDSEMITVAGGPDYGTFLVGTDGSPPLALGDWKIDRYETSNREYKAFVDAGGYRDTTWWDQPFRENGRTLSRATAMARFVDQTGRPGPATWVAGDYPNGQGDMPVGGVSWYEAEAYAKWAGKSLPTIYHWAQAASVFFSRGMVPSSNMEGTGPWPVGTPRGVSIVGVSDMAGNVREWIANRSTGDQRYILGGGWSDPTYSFVDAYAQPAMDRSEINGIRLVKYDPADTVVALAQRPLARKFTDYDAIPSASDAVFEGYRHQFDYDPLPLDATVESRDTTSEEWNVERVSFRAAYGDERMEAWLFFPKHGEPPYQTVVYFPGSGALNQRSSVERRDMTGSFVVKSGRVFVLPIYKSTYERHDSLTSDLPNESIFWRDHVVMWGKDYRRTLDYLSTRSDIDTTRFAYFGYSWGGNMGGIIPAIEPRIKVVVLYVAGLTMERGRPETDPINFLPHVTVPVLMLNGKYDFFFPTETAQRPFFERLGTPAADKKWVVYEGGHDVPRPRLIAETLAWLDRYLGPVKVPATHP